MSTPIYRSLTSLSAVMALVGVLVVPLCGGALGAHLCPMEMATVGSGDSGADRDCHGPAGPGLKRQPMDCCVAPQADSSPALQSGKLQVAAPQPWPTSIAVNLSPVTTSLEVLPAAAPRRLDHLSLHSSLLL